jgi:hypothetical protein
MDWLAGTGAEPPSQQVAASSQHPGTGSQHLANLNCFNSSGSFKLKKMAPTATSIRTMAPTHKAVLVL